MPSLSASMHEAGCWPAASLLCQAVDPRGLLLCYQHAEHGCLLTAAGVCTTTSSSHAHLAAPSTALVAGAPQAELLPGLLKAQAQQLACT